MRNARLISLGGAVHLPSQPPNLVIETAPAGTVYQIVDTPFVTGLEYDQFLFVNRSSAEFLAARYPNLYRIEGDEMNWFQKLFSQIAGFFTSPKARAVEQQIAALLPVALTIVQTINALAPNRTLTQINLVATKYGVPTINAIAADPNAVGNVLLNLATEILRKNHAPDATISVLNTVIQLAVVAAQSQV